ncbi:hypothetical protein ACJJTC_002209 [Scirpophaga incertulas]
MTARHELTQQLTVDLNIQTIHVVMACSKTRPKLLQFIEHVATITHRRNSTLPTTTHQNTNPQPRTQTNTTNTPTVNYKIKTVHIPQLAQPGHQGVTLKSIALFMDAEDENMGIAFCSDRARNVTISPGLGALLNGSTKRNIMRRRVYEQLPIVHVENCMGRIVRKSNKTIVLFPMHDHITAFQQASAVLTEIGSRGNVETKPIKVSMDAMTIGYIKGETRDLEGVLLASKYHEIVVYEDRGQDLGFLGSWNGDTAAATHDPTISPGCHAAQQIEPELSGSERLQQSMERQNNKTTPHKKTRTSSDAMNIVTKLFKSALLAPFGTTTKICKNSRGLTPRTKDITAAPKLRPVRGPRDHLINAFLEFVALTGATLRAHTETCKEILQNYVRSVQGMPVSGARLRENLEKAGAAVYDNDRGLVIAGTMSGSYMAAYSGSGGFVGQSPLETKVFDAPEGDPVVVVADCTRVMLESKILAMANTMAGELLDSGQSERWAAPTVRWTTGVPGCGKTKWVLEQMRGADSLAVTTTTEAAEDMRERLRIKHNIYNRRRLAAILAKFQTPISPSLGGVEGWDFHSKLSPDLLCRVARVASGFGGYENHSPETGLRGRARRALHGEPKNWWAEFGLVREGLGRATWLGGVIIEADAPPKS